MGYDPYKHAKRLGIAVQHSPILTNSYWIPARKAVILRETLGKVNRRAALAVNLARAELGHVEETPENTAEAETLAFDNMLKGQRASVLWGTVTAALAVEFGVSAHVLQSVLEASLGS